TPPLPPINMIFFSISVILHPSFNNTGFPKLVIFPSPCADANHEIFQLYMDIAPMYNNRPGLEYRASPNRSIIEIYRLHLVVHELLPDDVAYLVFLHKVRLVFLFYPTLNVTSNLLEKGILY